MSAANAHECAPDGTPFRAPARPDPRRDLRRALRHFRALLRDKDNTAEVFGLYEALPSKRFHPRARALALSMRGEELRAREPFLPAILDDSAALRAMRPGSVAHAYADFMESEGLTASGLAEAARRAGRPVHGDLIEWYAFRLRDTHDLMHVLTGYGRDALGEACVLLYAYGQDPSPGHLLLGYAGALHIRRNSGAGAPVVRAAREARATGRHCAPLAELSIRELLAMDLNEARRMLRIGEPGWYRKCHDTWRGQGIDPFGVLRV